MTAQETLKAIKPGENYPTEVTVTEDGKTIKFCLCSYFVGMYLAVYIDGNCVCQTGDHNNKKCVAGLKKDLVNAIKRGATVEFGSLHPVKKDM